MKRITEIGDCYGFTFAEFYRGDNPLAVIYYNPSQSSQMRLSRLINELLQSGRIKAYQPVDGKPVWRYQVIRRLLV